jgi:membrane AbrB-like protein
MSARSGSTRAWLVLVLGAAVASGVFAVLGLPSPVLFGSLVGGMVHALTARHEVEMSPRVFRVGQALVGVVIGGLVKLPTLVRLAADWRSVLLVTVGTLVISLLAGRLLALHRDVSPATGAFALIAGGASGIVALARDLGADDRVVTIVQYLRVLLVLLAMPLVAGALFDPPTGAGELVDGPTRWLPDLVFVALAVCLGLLLQRFVRAPATSLLGPLLVAVAISTSGVLGEVSVPTLLANVGYALIGIRVGLRFTRTSLVSIARLLPLATLLIALVIAACALLGRRTSRPHPAGCSRCSRLPRTAGRMSPTCWRCRSSGSSPCCFSRRCSDDCSAADQSTQNSLPSGSCMTM